MVIDIVHVRRLAGFELEYDSPVCANGNSPKSRAAAFETVQAESGDIQVRNLAGSIQTRKNVPQLFHVFGEHATQIIVFVKTP